MSKKNATKGSEYQIPKNKPSPAKSDQSLKDTTKNQKKQPKFKKDLKDLNNSNNKDMEDEKLDETDTELFNDIMAAPIKDDEQKINNIFDKHATEIYSCKCNLCNLSIMQKVTSNHTKFIHNFFDGYDFAHNPTNEGEKDFVFVLKRLYPPKNISRTIRITIPETIGFINGEPKFIVTTTKDKTLKYSKQKERLPLNEIRKFFNERKKRKEDTYQYEEENNIQDQQSTSVLDKTNTTDMNKKKASSNQTIEMINSSKEVALVKYVDDSTQILSENDLNNLLTRHKTGSSWKEIQYLQMFTKTRRLVQNMIRIYFVYDTEKDNALFTRASNEILFLTGEIPQASEDCIPITEEEKFEEEMKNNSEETYCLYLLYKIYHFVEQVYHTQIFKMSADFVKDEQGNFLLINILRLQHSAPSNIRRTLDEYNTYTYTKHSDTLFISDNSKLHTDIDEKNEDSERIDAIKFLNNIIIQYFDYITKPKANISKILFEESLTDEKFSEMYPNAPCKLTQLLNNQIPQTELKKFIMQICKDLDSKLTILTFNKPKPPLKSSKLPKITNSPLSQTNNNLLDNSIMQIPQDVSSIAIAMDNNNKSMFQVDKLNKIDAESLSNIKNSKDTLSPIQQDDFQNSSQDFKKDSSNKFNNKNVFKTTTFSNGRKGVVEFDPTGFLENNITPQTISPVKLFSKNQRTFNLNTTFNIDQNGSRSASKKKTKTMNFFPSPDETQLAFQAHMRDIQKYQKLITDSISANKFVGLNLKDQSKIFRATAQGMYKQQRNNTMKVKEIVHDMTPEFRIKNLRKVSLNESTPFATKAFYQ